MGIYNNFYAAGVIARMDDKAQGPIDNLRFSYWDLDAEVVKYIVDANEKYVPELVNLVTNVLKADSADWDTDEFDEMASHAYQAILILAHLKAKEAQTLLLNFLLKPKQFQEIFSEFYSTFPSEVIATLCTDCVTELISMVKNTALFSSVRASVLGALTILAVNGKIEKSVPLEMFFELANSKEFDGKEEELNRLLDSILSLNPMEKKDKILELYEQEKMILEHTDSPMDELEFVFSPKYWDENFNYPLDIFPLIRKLDAISSYFDRMEADFNLLKSNIAKKKNRRKKSKLAKKKNRK